MSKLIYLKHNTKKVVLNDISSGDDRIYESMVFYPGEIWYDEQGVIRQFSMQLKNNVVGNFFLMPNDFNQQKYFNTIARDLAEFGIKMIANSLTSGGGLIINLAAFLFEKYGNLAISDLTFNNKLNLAYIALENNEAVFNGKLSIHTAMNLEELLFYIRNDHPYQFFCQLSRDGKYWNDVILYPRTFDNFYFKNRQPYGYFRFTGASVQTKVYEVRAKCCYQVQWNDTLQNWDLFLL